MNFGDYLSHMLVTVIVLIVLLIMVLGVLWAMVSGEQQFKTKQPITPTLKINIENGVADTTYIYTFK